MHHAQGVPELVSHTKLGGFVRAYDTSMFYTLLAIIFPPPMVKDCGHIGCSRSRRGISQLAPGLGSQRGSFDESSTGGHDVSCTKRRASMKLYHGGRLTSPAGWAVPVFR